MASAASEIGAAGVMAVSYTHLDVYKRQVGGYPLESERERLVNTIGAEEIFINTPIDECLLNVSQRPDVYKKYVHEWFETYNAANIPPTFEIAG